MDSTQHRNQYLRMDDQGLLTLCELRNYQGSGPGGQHRNKTNTGVRLTLAQFNLEIRCCEDRSQFINRMYALRRLRLQLALQCRTPPPSQPMVFPGSQGHLSASNPQYALWIAELFDYLEATQGELRTAAETYGLSSSAIVRLLGEEKNCWEELQKLRHKYGKPPIRGR